MQTSSERWPRQHAQDVSGLLVMASSWLQSAVVIACYLIPLHRQPHPNITTTSITTTNIATPPTAPTSPQPASPHHQPHHPPGAPNTQHRGRAEPDRGQGAGHARKPPGAPNTRDGQSRTAGRVRDMPESHPEQDTLSNKQTPRHQDNQDTKAPGTKTPRHQDIRHHYKIESASHVTNQDSSLVEQKTRSDRFNIIVSG